MRELDPISFGIFWVPCEFVGRGTERPETLLGDFRHGRRAFSLCQELKPSTAQMTDQVLSDRFGDCRGVVEAVVPRSEPPKFFVALPRSKGHMEVDVPSTS